MSKYREISRSEREATYEERRSKAIATGARVLYVTCPLCGLDRPLETYKGVTRFQVKTDFAIIQVRYGGGRGIGFFLNESESVKPEDLRNTYPEVLDNLREMIEQLHETFKNL